MITTKECLEQLDAILCLMKEYRNGATIKIWIELEDLEALNYAKEKLTEYEVIKCRLRQYEECGYSPDELQEIAMLYQEHQEDDLK